VRVVQSMLLAAFILDPLPQDTVDRIAEYARALGVDETMIAVAQHQAQGARDLIKVDFSRAGYHREHSMPSGLPEFSIERPDHWEAVEDDPVLAGRWESLADLPESTLGHQVWQFYRSRGFSFPGSPGSAAPFLAQHDWVHVIADYGSTVESEIEVFGLISRADANPEAFALLAMVLSLFETGSLASVSIFQQDPRYMTRNARRMGERLADAMYRGAVVARHFRGEDLMAVDWFSLADRDVTDIRRLIGIPPKSTAALRAGSVGPWEPGGISDFQVGLGQQAALARGEEYDPHGATVLPPEIEA
jgi:ubiquinone biosynthesis protein Coq4